jgi:hypothetical protein
MSGKITLTVCDSRELAREAIRASVCAGVPSGTLAHVIEGLTQGAAEMSDEDRTFLLALLPQLEALRASWREAERIAYEAAPSEGGRCWTVGAFRGTFAECKAHIAERVRLAPETPAHAYQIRLSL